MAGLEKRVPNPEAPVNAYAAMNGLVLMDINTEPGVNVMPEANDGRPEEGSAYFVPKPLLLQGYAVTKGEFECPTPTAVPCVLNAAFRPAPEGRVAGSEYFVPNPVDPKGYAATLGDVLFATMTSLPLGENRDDP